MYLCTHMKCIYNVSPNPLSSELPEGVKLGGLPHSDWLANMTVRHFLDC